MIDSHKPCLGCNNGTMHRVDNIREGVIRGYWCPKCNNWETLDVPLRGKKKELKGKSL